MIQPLVSIVVICAQQDKPLLRECLLHLPKNARVEVVLAETERRQPHEVQLNSELLVKDEVGGKLLKLWFSQLDFADLRNRAKQHATGRWIFSLDVDEVVPEYQWESLLDMLESLPDTVDGVRVSNFSAIRNPDGSGYARSVATSCRIFRNKDGIDWYGCVHEMPEWNIDPECIVDSSILIHHTGYDTDRDTILRKYGRNIMLLARALTNADTDEKRDYFFKYLTSSSNSFHQLKGDNNGWR